MELGVHHDEPKVLQFKNDISIAGLALAITEGDEATLQSAKEYTDIKVGDVAEQTGTAVASLDNSIKIYSSETVADVEMAANSSFYYLNTTDKKIYLRSKAEEEITEIAIASLA